MNKLLLVASIGALSMDKGAGVIDLEKHSFPADFVFESLAAFNLSLAEIKAFLRSGEKKTVRVQCRDDLARVVNSISQVALLNKSDALLNIYAHVDADDGLGAEPELVTVAEPELAAVAESTAEESQADAQPQEDNESQADDLEEVSTESAKSPAKASAKAKKNSKKEDK